MDDAKSKSKEVMDKLLGVKLKNEDLCEHAYSGHALYSPVRGYDTAMCYICNKRWGRAAGSNRWKYFGKIE